jgi:hypothetical protein
MSGLAALAATSSDMECSYYLAMHAADQMTTVESMRSSVSDASKMLSTYEIAKKMVTSCSDHPTMRVHEIMEKVMPRTTVMPH